MRLPTIQGVIDRRVLVNYRVIPEILQRLLPAPFRPQVTRGWGIAGICLIRLKQVRPAFCPAWIGIGSENAAHRIAVEWDHQGVTRTGVYIPRRESSSWFNVLTGGRIFPGVHHHSRIESRETPSSVQIDIHGHDSQVEVRGRVTDRLPPDSVFHTLAEADQFFQAGACGYSPTRQAGQLEGLRLETLNWQLQPLRVEHVSSSFFSDSTKFPAGTIEFDSAFLMRGIQHSWHALDPLSSCVASV